MPVDINELSEGWLELESDPGLFTLLLEDFGVKGVQVEEIYDLQKSLEGPVYGFIFLFRWIEERRSRRKVVDEADSFVRDEEVVNNIFFAQQMVPNSCATHALLSVLINCPSLHLGATVSRLKAHTSGMSPENKGWAIGNTPELARAHNSHAMPQAKRRHDKSSSFSTGRYTGEAFHFVSYVPIDGRLFELDGLKPYPIDHGPWGDSEDWTEKFRRVITDRLGPCNQDICFNLMAVVPDRRLAVNHKLKLLKTNKQIVLEALQQLVSLSRSKPKSEQEGTETLPEGTAVEDLLDHKSDRKSSPETKDRLKLKKLSLAATSSKPSLPEDWSDEVQADFSTPLTIQTSPAPSGDSSTDTASEVGSAFHSPSLGKAFCSTKRIGGESSSGSLIKKLSPDRADSTEAMDASSSKESESFESVESVVVASSSKESGSCELPEGITDKKVDPKLCSKYPELFEPHTFAPKDLLALLKNLENEIYACEMNLRDENEKRRKYKVDDSRRTHNYDEFICTFLSMLAQQGKLADLVQQHLLQPKKPGNPVGKLNRAGKKSEARSPNRSRRGRNKYRKRK